MIKKKFKTVINIFFLILFPFSLSLAKTDKTVIPLKQQDTPSVLAGYTKVYKADFSGLTLKTFYDNQWWYVFHGKQNGMEWSDIRNAAGMKKDGDGFRIQTLVYSKDVNLQEYQEALLLTEESNTFLRFINHKRDGKNKSRVQLMSTLDYKNNPITGLYSSIDLRISSRMKSHLLETWLDLVELHDNGGELKWTGKTKQTTEGGQRVAEHISGDDVYRLGLYINPDQEKKSNWFVLQLRNESQAKVVFRTNLLEYTGFDKWTTISVQYESSEKDKKSFVRIWINNKLEIEIKDIFIGYPIQNFHVVKNYIDNTNTAVQDFEIDIDNWEFWLKL